MDQRQVESHRRGGRATQPLRPAEHATFFAGSGAESREGRRDINEAVRRLVLVFFVAALSLSASGVMDLVIPETCSITEANTSQQHRDCSATCVRCHCGRSIEVSVYGVVTGHVPLVTEAIPPASFVSTGNPSEILHVPKL
jgi:hypothetical protein